jgi:transglutaminase-like putative cysteine protease
MILTATHTTTYMYSAPVSICHTEVHLAPRPRWHQTLLDHQLTVTPEPSFAIARTDYFGNPVTYFSIHEPHRTLTITSQSRVELQGSDAPGGALTPAWESVREHVLARADEEALAASEFAYASPLVTTGAPFAAYAAESFAAGRPIHEAAFDLCHRIYAGFRYDQRATTVTTAVEEVLALRQGVCQDFAHVMIACLRSLGLAARYVSGYVRSGENTVGAEASHAWISVFAPGFGWFDFDPTNDVIPDREHVTIAWGRDYSDVTPVKGVALGGGDQVINVAVEVLPPAAR